MIFPSKHLKLEKSLLNLGALVIQELKKKSNTIDNVWIELQSLNVIKNYTFNEMVLTCDFLFSVGAIIQKEGGELCLN